MISDINIAASLNLRPNSSGIKLVHFLSALNTSYISTWFSHMVFFEKSIVTHGLHHQRYLRADVQCLDPIFPKTAATLFFLS